MAPKRAASCGSDQAPKRHRTYTVRQVVEKGIKDNCKGWSREDTHIRLDPRTGLTLQATVTMEVEKKTEG